MFAKLRTDTRVFAPTDSPPANPSTQIAPLRRHFSRPWKVRKSIPFQTAAFLGILGILGSVVSEKRACKRICGLFFLFATCQETYTFPDSNTRPVTIIIS